LRNTPLPAALYLSRIRRMGRTNLRRKDRD
jgi:hypothetical protein